MQDDIGGSLQRDVANPLQTSLVDQEKIRIERILANGRNKGKAFNLVRSWPKSAYHEKSWNGDPQENEREEDQEKAESKE